MKCGLTVNPQQARPCGCPFSAEERQRDENNGDARCEILERERRDWLERELKRLRNHWRTAGGQKRTLTCSFPLGVARVAGCTNLSITTGNTESEGVRVAARDARDSRMHDWARPHIGWVRHGLRGCVVPLNAVQASHHAAS